VIILPPPGEFGEKWSRDASHRVKDKVITGIDSKIRNIEA
jgi:hypothetical protein